jgi:flagellar biosynthetic protein FliR
MANMFDPTTGTQQGIISRFLYMIILVLYFETGMYEVTILMLNHSFGAIELGTFNLYAYDGNKIAIREVSNMFAFAFSFAFPLFFVGFIMDIYYGYGTKSMPAFSPFIITFQIKFTLIFVFMMLGMEIFSDSFIAYFTTKFE